jgi:hypothetical protein
MIWPIFVEIIVNWLMMGLVLGIMLAGCLYFAILCEKIVDRVFRR